MHSPIEKIFAKADEALEVKASEERLLEEKRSIKGNIGLVMRSIRVDTVLPNWVEGEGDSVDIIVAPRVGRDKRSLLVKARLKKDTGATSSPFDVYRITAKKHTSDTMRQPSDTYEIAVADPESESGFRTLALIGNERAVHRSSAGWDFGSENEVRPSQLNILVEKGYYADPRGLRLIEEVHDILGVAMEQSAAGRSTAAQHSGRAAVHAQVS
ncbi:MAG TPA: hypothetical protein VIH90_01455 [Candidatus Saccharimonadales bacterium]